jgi:hypothetical protein
MLEQKYVVGSKISRTSQSSFRYLSPDEIESVISYYNTEWFDHVLSALEIPKKMYNHTIWSNFASATREIRKIIGIGSNVSYMYSQSPSENYDTYTLQLWPSQETFDTIVSENITAYNNLRAARSVLFSDLGLEMEIRKSYIPIDSTVMLTHAQMKSTFETLSPFVNDTI